jgi:hypothetical protein
MALAHLERNLAWSSLVAGPSVLLLGSIQLGHAVGVERQESVSMAVEDAILAIQIQEGVTDARFGQERVKALHCRIAEDVEGAVVEALGIYVKSFAQLPDAIGLVLPWRPAFSFQQCACH